MPVFLQYVELAVLEVNHLDVGSHFRLTLPI